jgi:hypothetical protein
VHGFQTSFETLGGALNSLSDGDQVTVYAQRTAGGLFRTREAWSLMQIGLSLPAGADWTYVQGFDADAVPGGRA